MNWLTWQLGVVRRRLADIASRYQLARILKLLVLFFLIWLIGAFVMYLFERGHRDPVAHRFDTYNEAVWGILVHLVSGFEDYVPATTGGRATSVVVMLLGVTLAGYFTAVVASILVDLAQRSEYVSPVPAFFRFKDHILICGWDRRGPELIELISAAYEGRSPPVVILASQASKIPLRDVPHSQVWSAEGDPTSERDLERAALSGARVAVILSDPAWSVGAGTLTPADEFVVLAGLAIESRAPQVHTIAASTRDGGSDLLHRAGIDEVVEIRQVGRLLLAQAALVPGITQCYEELLMSSRETNEIYRVPVPGSWRGITYAEAAGILARGNSDSEPVLLLGLWPAGRSPVLNPRREPQSEQKVGRNHRLASGDQLLILAYSFPRLEERAHGNN